MKRITSEDYNNIFLNESSNIFINKLEALKNKYFLVYTL